MVKHLRGVLFKARGLRQFNRAARDNVVGRMLGIDKIDLCTERDG